MTTMHATIYHNPRCSKSREALRLLQNSGIRTHIVDYLQQPPNAETLRQLLQLLALDPAEIIRTQDTLYKTANPEQAPVDTESCVTWLQKYPSLLQRPIVVCNGRALIARPPERVFELIPTPT